MRNILDTIMGFLSCPAKRQEAEAALVAALLKVEAWKKTCEKAQEQAQRYFEQAQADRILAEKAKKDLERCSKQLDSLRVPPPQYIREFTSNDIRAVLNAQEKQAFTFDWIPWDEVYPICSWQDWEVFINHDDTQAFKYDAKRFDCNRFACVYFGRALAWGGSLLAIWGVTENNNVGHMWNYLLGFDHTLAQPVLERRHFEPQNDFVWRPWEKSWLLFRAYG